MKGIEPSSAIILKTRVLGELQPQVSKTGFAFVENRPTKKRVTFDIQCDVRQAFCCIEEIVRLEPRGRCEGVKWIFFVTATTLSGTGSIRNSCRKKSCITNASLSLVRLAIPYMSSVKFVRSSKLSRYRPVGTGPRGKPVRFMDGFWSCR